MMAIGDALEDDDEAEHDEDQHVAGEHVGEETDGERDQPHELGDDLERRRSSAAAPSARRGGIQLLKYRDDAVVADALDVRGDERDQREASVTLRFDVAA